MEPNELDQLGRNRADLIDDILRGFGRSTASLQSWLFAAFYDDFIQRVVSEGAIRQGVTAIGAVNSSPVWKRYYRESRNVGGFILDSFDRLRLNLSDYFDAVTGKKTLSDVDRAAKLLIEQYGFDGKKFIEGGYLYNLMNDTTVERRVKSAAIQAIRSGRSLKDFQKDIRGIIEGDKKEGKLGIVEAHYYTNATTAFSEFDRTVSLQMADKYKLNYAVWSGPKLTTSRHFCETKKGKVFSREQIKEFDSQNWQGKIPGQSTLISAGGYNCVDSLLWISDEMAEKMM